MLLATLAGAFTGSLLPWDQMSLWAVTVQGDLRGVLPAAFREDVRFVLIGTTEISQATYRMWTLVHLLGLPLAIALLMLWSHRRSRRPRTSAGTAATIPD